MGPHEYDLLRHFLERHAGIVLGDRRQDLVHSRLAPVLEEFGLDDIGQLVRRLGTGASQDLTVRVIDAMTTNETFWFRDPGQFRLLEDLVGGTNIRVWSAACSSGQEPYSIGMTLLGATTGQQASLAAGAGGSRSTVSMPQAPHIEVVATDISPSVLATARRAVYCGQVLERGLSREHRDRFFRPEGTCWAVRPEIRRAIQFRELNLLAPFTGMGRFQVIFCRNVLIYFSRNLRETILSRIATALEPGGYLFLGSSESLAGLSRRFEMVSGHGSIAYRLKG